MSLISEALKRQQQSREEDAQSDLVPDAPASDGTADTPDADGDGGSVASAAMPPPLPPVDPEGQSAPDESGSGTSSVVLNVLGIIVLVVILASGAAWAGFYIYKQLTDSDRKPTRAVILDSGVDDGSEADSISDIDEGVDGKSAEIADPPVSSDRGTIREVTVDRGTIREATAGSAIKPTRRAAVDWPRLEVTSLIAGRKGGGAAIINDSVVGVDDSVNGAVVVGLTKTGVTLRYNGEERFVRVGSVVE